MLLANVVDVEDARICVVYVHGARLFGKDLDNMDRLAKDRVLRNLDNFKNRLAICNHHSNAAECLLGKGAHSLVASLSVRQPQTTEV